MTTQPKLSDFPKVQCPLIRQTFKVDQEQWRKHGSRLQLRSPEAYLVVDRVNPGYEWVFEDEETIAVEKLDGTNVKLLTEGGRLIALQNRLNVIDPLQIIKGRTFIIEGIFRAIAKGYVALDGEQAGEVMGPKLQGNPYGLEVHEWYPFTKAIADLAYRSFHEHERTFDNWSVWFKDWLVSRYHTKRSPKGSQGEKVMAEGVVFYNLKRKAEGKSWMAKLRRDMFPWYYSDQIEILGYDKAGRDKIEDQTEFD
ncbi:MAG: hypothetical protein HN919_12190 [Verrucomicrobia bacterium]|mgnify:CR=1 FL=1|jgi:hypothetical protein|nr:hypothetical protein [Verrucomicrobiota bacterium]MBT7067058.1 hypothetical protein [Verrucomicrobiota bacterium]MBT7701006.1 hypothetical protein [Verrucomicrobiota bacterium]